MSDISKKIDEYKTTYEEQTKNYTVGKGYAKTQTYNFPARSGYTRHLYVKAISGTGSDAATVNIHDAGAVSAYAPTLDSNLKITIGCLYTKD